VVPTHRGKGIGTKMFEAAVAPYRETGINIGLVAGIFYFVLVGANNWNLLYLKMR
jgi:GNAT superfamily N-acetyltransferase